ncbi:YadA-like family protein [Pseudomonas sp. BF61]|uniref:YadA-like family protein n=1 Tax=Pseudomonas sp. BF61 TaxID=2741068 RepID=UPI001C0B0599|nr:YadA-like family protein [Pseudomonas sp. BF61]MBU4629261.1 YadA-like family protein [Pseudomonas sp. BF61]
MNKIYSVLWNASMGCWMVASELDCQRTKSGRSGAGRIRKLNVQAVLIGGILSFMIGGLPSAWAGTAIQGASISATTTGGASPATVDGNAIAIGAGSGATATNYSIAIGDAANATSATTGEGAVAVGRLASATANGAVAIGYSSKGSAVNSTALGRGANASTVNSVALGANSTTVAATATTSGVINGTTYTYAGGAPVGVVSLGSASNERQLSNVAAGKVTSTSTDAVNGSQLFSTNTEVNSLGTSLTNITSGGGIKYFHSNSILGDSTATGTDSVAVGPTASATATNAMALGNGATAGTANSVALGSGATTAAATATASGVINGTTYTYAGAAPVGVLSLGSLGNERQLSNVAAGKVTATSTDAVNGSQLFSTNTAVNSLGTTLNNISNGAGIKYFHSNSALADSAATGTDSVAIGPAAAASGINSIALGNGAAASLANSIALGSGATTVAATATPSGIINGTTYTYAGTAPIGVLSLGSLGNERQLSNVAAGKVTATSTDAVNGSQLFSTNTAVNSLGTTLNNISSGAGIKYFHANSLLADSTANGTDSVAVGPLAVSGGANSVALGNGATTSIANSVALGSGSSATGTTLATAAYGVGGTATTGGEVNVANGADGRRITGLAAGASLTDAVNVSQLNKVGQDTATALGGGAVLDPTTGVWTAPSYATNSIDASGANAGALTSSNVGAALGNLNTGLTNTAAIAVKYDDATTKAQITFNPAGAATTLTNVAPGALTATSSDAVNGSQLFATNTAVNNISNGAGIKYFHANSILADSTASGTDSVAVGPLAVSGGTNSVALGNGAITSTDNSVALGSGSSATGTTLSATGYGIGDDAPDGEVNVANGASGRRITGVAAGASATDAVNVGQLNNIGQQLATRLGGGAALDPTNGQWTTPEYTLAMIDASGTNNGDVSSNVIGSALGNLNTGLINTAAIAVKYDDATTKNQITLNPAGAATTLTNVASGALTATSTDAVNGSQLYATNTAITNISNGAGIKYFHANSILADSTASGTDSVAVGPGAIANGANTVAIGNNAQANSDNATAIGLNALALGDKALSIGASNYVQGDDAVAIGGTNITLGTGSVAVGGQNYSVDGGVTLGNSNSAIGQGSIALGNASSATEEGTLSFGDTAVASATNALALGTGATANIANSIALGNGSMTSAASATAGGTISGTTYSYAGAAPTGVLSVGSAGSERQITNVAAGQVSATSTDAVNGSQLFATNSALGNINSGSGIKYFHANSILADGTASGTDSVAVGPLAVSGGANSVALGNGATTSIANSVALGSGSSTTGTTLATAAYGVGGTATTGGEVNVANGADGRRITGLAAGASLTDAVNVSQLNKVGQDTATALGGGAALDPATGTWTAPSYTTNSIDASGTNTGALTSSNVGEALGNLNTGLTNTAAIAVKYDDATTKTQITFNPAGAATTLTNVASGALTATSSDAVNGSQLFATNTAVNNISNGAGIKYFHANSILADSTASGTDSVAVGPAAIANGANTVAIGNNAQASSDNSVALGSSSVADRANSISVGAAGQERQITNVRAATAATDAVNLSQLTALGDDALLWNPSTGAFSASHGAIVANKITNVAAADVTATSTDAVNGSQLFALDTRVTGIDGRVTNIESNISSITNGGGIKYFRSNSTGADALATGNNAVAIGSNAVSSGEAAIANGNNASASGVGAVAVGQSASASASGSVALGSGASDDGRGAETYNGKYSGVANSSSGTVSVGNASTGATRTVSNVADGHQATDAVNVRQLDGAVQQANTYTDNTVSTINQNQQATTISLTKLENGQDGMFQVNNTNGSAKPQATGSNAVAGGAGSVASAQNSVAVGTNAKATANNAVALGNNSVADRQNSVSVGATGSERQITHVSTGTADTDAVNVAQLNKSVGDIVNNANSYADSRYDSLKKDLHKQDSILSAGIAGAMAMASLPQPYSAGANMTAVGVSNYRGQSALALGASRISDDGHWVSKVQASTNTQGDFGVAVGVGYQW